VSGWRRSEPYSDRSSPNSSALRLTSSTVPGRQRKPATSSPGRSRLPALHQHIAQHNGIIVRFVTRGEDERDRPLPRKRPQPLERVGMLAQLFEITAPEFLPALRIVAEPFSQYAARRDILHPLVDRGVRLLDAPRPQPVDQYALAVARRRHLIGALQLDVAGS